ncbi:MAG: hypothetical protein ACAI25_13200, partial [Planctomycetota bacterium]
GALLLVAALAVRAGSTGVLAALGSGLLLAASLGFTSAGALFAPLVLVLDALRSPRASRARSLLATLPALAATGAWLALRHRALGDEHLAALLPGNLAGVAVGARGYAMARGFLDALARTGTTAALGLRGPEAGLGLIALALAVAALASATRRSRDVGAAAALLALTFLPTVHPITVDASPAHALVPSLGFALVAAVLIDTIGNRSKAVRTATAAALIGASGMTMLLLALDRCS